MYHHSLLHWHHSWNYLHFCYSLRDSALVLSRTLRQVSRLWTWWWFCKCLQRCRYIDHLMSVKQLRETAAQFSVSETKKEKNYGARLVHIVHWKHVEFMKIKKSLSFSWVLSVLRYRKKNRNRFTVNKTSELIACCIFGIQFVELTFSTGNL